MKGWQEPTNGHCFGKWMLLLTRPCSFCLTVVPLGRVSLGCCHSPMNMTVLFEGVPSILLIMFGGGEMLNISKVAAILAAVDSLLPSLLECRLFRKNVVDTLLLSCEQDCSFSLADERQCHATCRLMSDCR
jgi:hypothetical protein